MTPCDRYLNAINELVDGTLGPIRRAELELHLEGCDGCRALADDLKEIARAAGSLEPMAPPERVWQQVSAQLQADGRITTSGQRRGLRHQSVSILALAAALVLAVGAALYMLRPGGGGPAAPPAKETTAATPVPAAPAPSPDVTAAGNASQNDPVKTVASELASTQEHFTNLVELSKKSDPKIAAVVQTQLHVMNTAIENTRKALESDPQNEPARTSLYELLKQKIQFLQDTIVLMNMMRQGDAAGAAQIVESGKT